MIDIKLTEVTQCDCCGKDKLNKTFYVETDVGASFLGYKCCAKWFKLNMSGNKFAAHLRLEHKLRHIIPERELEDIMLKIKASEVKWQYEKNAMFEDF